MQPELSWKVPEELVEELQPSTLKVSVSQGLPLTMRWAGVWGVCKVS